MADRFVRDIAVFVFLFYLVVELLFLGKLFGVAVVFADIKAS